MRKNQQKTKKNNHITRMFQQTLNRKTQRQFYLSEAKHEHAERSFL